MSDYEDYYYGGGDDEDIEHLDFDYFSDENNEDDFTEHNERAVFERVSVFKHPDLELLDKDRSISLSFFFGFFLISDSDGF